jgi:hypothetical protein
LLFQRARGPQHGRSSGPGHPPRRAGGKEPASTQVRSDVTAHSLGIRAALGELESSSRPGQEILRRSERANAPAPEARRDPRFDSPWAFDGASWKLRGPFGGWRAAAHQPQRPTQHFARINAAAFRIESLHRARHTPDTSLQPRRKRKCLSVY